MKVVINRCFGGFGLSPLAVKRMAELNGRPCYFFVDDRKPDGSLQFGKYKSATIEEAESSLMFSAFDIPNPTEVIGEEVKWKNLTTEQRKAHNDLYEKHYLQSGRDAVERHDSKLVQVVEELGERANGAHAKLAVIEIPDGTNYIVEEYDGSEHIAEAHQTWR